MITIWSDIHCPWAYVALLRLHRMRDHLGADQLIFDLRSYPRELVAGNEISAEAAQREVVALAQLEPTAFSALQSEAWPTSNLAAFEAQKWGFSQGQEIGESFDLALRRAVFLHGHNLGVRTELLAVSDLEGLMTDQLGSALDDGRFRKAVITDLNEAIDQAIIGSPQVVLPDGTSHHNPGITYREERGIPIIVSDHPSVYEELVQVGTVED
jgi:predicted DsbA family dithiol-disulfide isomerase